MSKIETANGTFQLAKKEVMKKVRVNAIIIALSFVIGTIGVVLAIVFDLYTYLGTIGGIILNACIFFGVFGILEMDDWTIWYKRLLIKKFMDTKGKIDMKVYDELTKKYIWMDARVRHLTFNDNQGVIFSLDLFDKRGGIITLPVTFNYVTGGVTIIDMAGDAYKVGKLQYIPVLYATANEVRLVTMEERMREFHDWLGYDSFNPDSIVYTIEK